MDVNVASFDSQVGVQVDGDRWICKIRPHRGAMVTPGTLLGVLRAARIRPPNAAQPSARRSSAWVCAGALIVCGLAAHALVAQSSRPVTGRVTAGGNSVPAVVVFLVGERDSTVARGLSDDDGRFRLAAPHAGVFRIRTLRIGFLPTISSPFTVTEAGATGVEVELTGLPVSLPAVTVAAERTCGTPSVTRPAAVYEAWDQARAAITAAALTTSERRLAITRIVYRRVLGPDGRVTGSNDATLVRTEAAAPWTTAPPADLRARGYVIEAGDSTAYRGPGLEMLASDAFVADHCLRMVPGANGTIGVAFDPIPERRRIAEISGTAWLDRESGLLRRLDFRFVNIRRELQDAHPGGHAEFARMADGGWVISSWELRLPVMELRIPARTRGAAAGADLTPQLVATHVVGGTLSVVTTASRGDTLLTGRRSTLRGVISDSVTGAPVADARIRLQEGGRVTSADMRGAFSFDSVLPGVYHLEVRTASLDSVNAAHVRQLVVGEADKAAFIRVPRAAQLAASLCGVRAPGAGAMPGILFGSVQVLGDTGGIPSAHLTAEWIDAQSREPRWKEATADGRGRFRFCGLPVGQTVVVRVAANGGSAEPAAVVFAPDRRLARLDFAVDPTVPATATLVGTVVADSANPRPVEDAEVAIPALAKSLRTDARGAFRLQDIPPGDHELVVRKVGYGALVATVHLAAGAIEQRRVVLTPMTVLGDVVITGGRRDPRLQAFDERRRLGLGHFLTRDDLKLKELVSLPAILADFPGTQVVRGRGPKGWLGSSRGQKSLGCSSVELEDRLPSERVPGACCYATVYLDGARLYKGGSDGQVPNLARFRPDELEAVEYYAGPAQTPAEYSDLNSGCGVLVLHTRRP